MAESEAVQYIVMEVVIQAGTVVVLAMREAGTGPISDMTSLKEVQRQRQGKRLPEGMRAVH